MDDKAYNIIYDHVFKTLVNDGFQESYAEEGAAGAVRRYRRGSTHKIAIKDAINLCKKSHPRTKAN